MMNEDCEDKYQKTRSAFAERLASYSQHLSSRERAALHLLLLRSMDPIKRMYWRRIDGLLNADEKLIFEDLLTEYNGDRATDRKHDLSS